MGQTEYVAGAQMHIAVWPVPADDAMTALAVQYEQQFANVIVHRMAAARSDIHDLLMYDLKRRAKIFNVI